MQHGAEYFALELVEIVQFKQSRGDIGSVVGIGRQLNLVADFGNTFHFVDVLEQVALGFGVDNRADVGVDQGGVADGQLVHRAFDHGEHVVGHVFLQAENAQGGATLAGAVEGGVEHVHAYLLGQGCGIDDHGVLAAGFGNQHRQVVAFAQGFVNQFGHFGGAGEDHAVDALVAGQRGADVAGTEYQLDGVGRCAGFMQQLDSAVGDQAGLLGRLGQYGVAGNQRGHHFADENR